MPPSNIRTMIVNYHAFMGLTLLKRPHYPHRVKDMAKRRVPYLLLLLLGLMCFSVGAYFEEAIAFFNNPVNLTMDDSEFFIAMAASLVSIVLFLVEAYRHLRLGVSWGFLVLFIVLVASNAVGLYLFPKNATGMVEHLDGTTSEFTYILTDMNRFRYFCMFSIGCIYLYLLFCVFPKVLKNANSLMFLFYATVFVTYFALAYSLVKEFDVYKQYFDPNVDITRATYAASFFFNRNTYGTCLVLGICALMFIHNRHPFWWNYPLMIILFIELFFVISKTSMIISAIILVIFAIYRFVVTAKRHWIRNIIATCFAIAIPSVIFYLGYAKIFGGNDILSKWVANLMQALEGLDAPTMKSRFDIYHTAMEFLFEDPLRLVFGVGENNASFLLGAINHIPVTDMNGIFFIHNGFLHVLFSGGIIKLSIYCFTLIFFLVQDVRALIRGSKAAFPCLIFFIAFQIHGMTETTAFLIADTKGFMIILFAYVPVFADIHKIYGNFDRLPELSKDHSPLTAKLSGPYVLALDYILAGLFGVLLPLTIGVASLGYQHDCRYLALFGMIGFPLLLLCALPGQKKAIYSLFHLSGFLVYSLFAVLLLFIPNPALFFAGLFLLFGLAFASCLLNLKDLPLFALKYVLPLVLLYLPLIIPNICLVYKLPAFSMSDYAHLFVLDCFILFLGIACYPGILYPLSHGYMRFECAYFRLLDKLDFRAERKLALRDWKVAKRHRKWRYRRLEKRIEKAI